MLRRVKKQRAITSARIYRYDIFFMGKLYHIFSMELTKPTLLEVTKTKKQPIEVTNQ